MTLSYNADQQALRHSVSDTIRRRTPLSALRDRPGTVEDDDRVRREVVETLDLFAMTVPEAHGGGGFAFADIAAAIEEFGAGLLPGSTSPTLTAILALVFGVTGIEAGAAAAELAGSGRAAVAFCSPAAAVTAEARDDGFFALTGRLSVVDGGTLATQLLCSADAPDGPSLFLLDTREPTVSRQPLQTLDLTHEAADISLKATTARRLRHPAGLEVARARAVCALVVSLEMVGAMDALVKMATTYANERFQFGRAIGSYQAVKHRLVGMMLETELARAATLGAVEQADALGGSLLSAASAAKAASADAGPFVAKEAIGVFGGIGYTWEHDAHLYFRRLNYLAALHGSAAEHLDTVIAELTRTSEEPKHD